MSADKYPNLQKIRETPSLQYWRIVSGMVAARGLPPIPGSDISRAYEADIHMCDVVAEWEVQHASKVEAV
jgi:hypothetical protein